MRKMYREYNNKALTLEIIQKILSYGVVASAIKSDAEYSLLFVADKGLVKGIGPVDLIIKMIAAL